MNIVFELALHSIAAFAATICFSVIFNIPKKELLYCGLSGSVGWFVYKSSIEFFHADTDLAIFFASFTVTAISRILSYRRFMPLTIYQIASIIPLVPGYGIYNTMIHLINEQNKEALTIGIDTLKSTGFIVIGAIIILSLPRKLFDFKFSR